MDLSGATPGQREIITTLDAPLSVAAGAGSGKTFTLTNRIAYAFVDTESKNSIDSIDEVLAITFSRTGAAEMKSRIRALLQDEGFVQQARGVEDAWITTIHAMCSRILREHALELGIDPAFEVVEDIERNQLWQAALESVLQSLAEDNSQPSLKQLFALFPENASNGLSSLLTNAWEKTLSMPDGFDSVCIPTPSLDLAAAFRDVIALGQEFEQVTKEWSRKLTKTDLSNLDAITRALQGAYEYQEEVSLDQESLDSGQFDMQRYLEVFFSFPKISAAYRAKKSDAAFFDSYRQCYAELGKNVALNYAASLTASFMHLLQLVDAQYQKLKGSGRLDNTDLLRMCSEALNTHPELRESYQKQFGLIMVDEFQDTDLLQVAIIDALSRNHGENVMTVGDAQQSIYRFRGADVGVFFSHKENQQETHQHLHAISLPDNFRSHGDVLSFVESIFSQPTFFGEKFLALQAKGQVNKTPDPIFESIPRISVYAVESRSGGGSLEDARKKTAQFIAKHFAQLREAGASPKDMAILLGSMTNVELYTQALAEAGFESIVAGGSVFGQAAEAQLVACLLTVAHNRQNENALYVVLESPLFNISDAALLALKRIPLETNQNYKPHGFAQRFWYFSQEVAQGSSEAVRRAFNSWGLSEAEISELIRALSLLYAFSVKACNGQAYQALRELLENSGWFYRLQAGTAQDLGVAGNLFKALELVRGWQQQNLSLPQLSYNYTQFLSNSKQAPGVLNPEGANFVRIMTIHASKGMEFDHVAVSEIRDGVPKPATLKIETQDNSVLALLQSPIPESVKATYKRLCEYSEADETISWPNSLAHMNAEEYDAFLTAKIKQGEVDDAQRLLYVGLTRAVKSLCLCLPFSGNKDFNYEKAGLVGLLHEAIGWEKTPEPSCVSFNYGGSAPAQVFHEVLVEKPQEEEVEALALPAFTTFDIQPLQATSYNVPAPRNGVVSYSSLSADSHNAQSQVDKEDEENSVHAGLLFDEDFALQGVREDAFALGSAFHRLAQRAIESRTTVGSIPSLPNSAYEKQVHTYHLSQDQTLRLRSALDRWLGSELCARFMNYPSIYAEVPFMLKIDAEAASIFLEGEIDGLALNNSRGENKALFIDYKTGGNSQESDQELHNKHLLQAQCYSLALLNQGFSEVEANFIRVEQASAEDPAQPQIVRYQFCEQNRKELEAAILAAYKKREA